MALAIASLACVYAKAANGDPCIQVLGGNDTTATIVGVDGPVFGEADGQTFFAADTIIEAITVWRESVGAPGSGAVGAHLFVVAADDSGEPNTHNILRDGPTIVTLEADSSYLYPVRFDLEPPLVLPRRGYYAFCVQGENCFLGQPWFNLLASESYASGHFFYTNRALTSCFLARVFNEFPALDMVFEIEFCRDQPVPVRRETWGRLKAMYR